jgi:hypothetical protein
VLTNVIGALESLGSSRRIGSIRKIAAVRASARRGHASFRCAALRVAPRCYPLTNRKKDVQESLHRGTWQVCAIAAILRARTPARNQTKSAVCATARCR